MAKQIKGSKTHIYANYKGFISNLKDIHRLKVREWKKVFMKIEMKQAGVTILTSDQIVFKTKTIKKTRRASLLCVVK